MRVALFGASGATGRLVLDQLIGRQHSVRALVRSAASLSAPSAQLQPVEGDATDAARVLETLREQEAVVLLLGTRDRLDGHTLSAATRCVVDGMQRLKIRRLVAVTRGALAAQPGKLVEWFALPARWKVFRQEALHQEGLIQNSALDWTILRPFRLIDAPASGSARPVASLPPPVFLRMTSRADLAQVVCAQVEATDSARQVLLLASKGV